MNTSIRVPEALSEIRRLSAKVGGDVSLVQGAGGNTSIKVDDTIWVKASGTWLSNAMAEDIFVPLDLRRLSVNIADNATDPTEGSVLQDIGRPSIETALHVLMPHKVVLHLHSVNAIAHAVRTDGETVVSERLDDIKWAWIPYARPGLPLATAVQRVLKDRSQVPNVLLLSNHGIVVGADDVYSAERMIQAVERALTVEPRSLKTDLPHRLAVPPGGPPGWRWTKSETIHSIAFDSEGLRILEDGCVLYPDHFVFLGDRIPKWPMSDDSGPPFAIVPDVGVVVRKNLTASAEAMLECFAAVMIRLRPEWAIRTLGRQDLDELANFDAEAYRRSLEV